MRPFQLLRKTPNLRSILHQTLLHPPPSHLSPRTTNRLPPSNPLTLTPRRHPLSPHPRGQRLYTTNPHKPPYDPTPSLNSPPASLSLSQRLRKLSREYGWSAFGVYMLLSALDFPFCFAAVRYLGTDRIGRWEHVVVERVKALIPESVREAWRTRGPEGERGAVAVGGETEVQGYAVVTGGGEVGVPGYDHGVKEAEKRNESENASIWTQLALAYAIHKSFIFIRVPLTVAVLPKVVKVLRRWGWDIGKRRPKGAS